MFSHDNDNKNTESSFFRPLNPTHLDHPQTSEHNTLESLDNNAKQSTVISVEETKIKREIVRVISSGNIEALKPNSGQAVTIGDHYVCVSFRDETESDYRAWEWHGHVVVCNEVSGFTQEYVYGNYFERLMTNMLFVDEESEEREMHLGLRGVIGGMNLNVGSMFCRNMNASSDR